MKFKSIQLLLLGTGIFVLSGQAAATSAGPSVIISFVIAGIVALLSALSMAEMASLMASCGSAYTYAYVGELIILSFFSPVFNVYLCFVFIF
jgi:APA family basic amino acid/polyamine antiporter